MSVTPGWYKDPADPSTQRYWDGEGWLGAPLPSDATPPPGPPEPEPTPEPEPVAAATETPGRAGPPDTPPRGLPRPPSGPPSRGAARPGVPAPLGAPAGPGSRYPAPDVPEQPHGMPLAPLGARLLARLIDIAAVLGLNVLANGYPVYLWFQETTPYLREAWRRAMVRNPSTEGLPAPGDDASTLQILILLVGIILWFLYEVPGVANTGQTPGKRLAGLRVVRLESTDRLGFGRAFRRWNMMSVPTLFWWCGIGFVMQFVDSVFILTDRRRRQSLHDRSAHTAVVVVRPAPNPPGHHPDRKEAADEPADPS